MTYTVGQKCLCGKTSTNNLRGRRQASKRKKNKYSLIIQNCTPEPEGNLKGMEKYNKIETDQYGIEIANMIRTIFHLQDDEKKYVMSAVET